MRMQPSNPAMIATANKPSLEEVNWATAMVKAYGREPNLISIAAFHESGHISVCSAMQFAFKNAYLARDKTTGLWGGWSESVVCGLHSESIDIAADPIRAFLLSVTIAGGIAGEREAGVHHPCSSLDELVVLKRVAVGISRVRRVEPEVVMASILDAAQFCISLNPVFFNTVATTLKLNKRLLRSEHERYLRSLTTVSLVSLLPEWLYSGERE